MTVNISIQSGETSRALPKSFLTNSTNSCLSAVPGGIVLMSTSNRRVGFLDSGGLFENKTYYELSNILDAQTCKIQFSGCKAIAPI